MNFQVVIYLLGKLGIVFSGALCIPMLFAVVTGDSASLALAISAILAGALGYVLNHYGKFAIDDIITIREGVAVVGCAWVILGVLGAMPYYLSGTLDIVSSVFESISGFTTTGATTIIDIASTSKSILFWRSMTHWMGGIGIVVLFIALLPNIGSGAVHMFNAEVTGATDDRVLPRIRSTSTVLSKLYVFFTTVEVVLLLFGGMDLYDAINHAFSTIATGGFSTYDASISHFNSPYIETVITFFMIVAGGNFALYYSVGAKGFIKGIKGLYEDTEFRTYVFLIILATLFITINLFWQMGMTITDAFRYGAFQVTSVISTTGFVSNDFDLWPNFSKYILVILMFIGACAGSTAGGIKVSRIVLLFKMAISEIKQTIHPSMVSNITLSGRRVAAPVLAGVLRFFFLFMFLFAILTLLLVTTGLTVGDSIGIISATISSVGPAFGIAGATCTYASIPPFGKLVICVAMLLGRLELFTLLVLIRPEFWHSSRNW